MESELQKAQLDFSGNNIDEYWKEIARKRNPEDPIRDNRSKETIFSAQARTGLITNVLKSLKRIIRPIKLQHDVEQETLKKYINNYDDRKNEYTNMKEIRNST